MSVASEAAIPERRSLLAKFRYAAAFQIVLVVALAVGAFLPTLRGLARTAAERRAEAKTEVVDAGVNHMARLLAMELGTDFLPELWQAADGLERGLGEGRGEEQLRVLRGELDRRARQLDERTAEKITYNGVLVDLVVALPRRDPRVPGEAVFVFPSGAPRLQALDVADMLRVGRLSRLTKLAGAPPLAVPGPPGAADGAEPAAGSSNVSPRADEWSKTLLVAELVRRAEELRGQAYLMPIRREGVPYGYAGLVVKTELISQQFDDYWHEFWSGLRRALVWLAGLSLAALVGGGLFIGLLASRLTRPLEAMRAVLADVRANPSQGVDTAQLLEADERLARIAADPLDEIGALRASFLELSGRLRTTLQQRAEALRRLQESTQQLQRADRLKLVGTLTYGLAHNLNNALAPVANLANAAALRHADDPRLGEMMAMIIDALARASNQIARLRDLTRLGSGETVAVDLQRVLDEALESVRRDMAAAGIASRLECDTLPPLMGNPVELWEVVTNLLVNAREALERSPPGRPREVLVRARELGEEAEIVVEDNGPGMSPEVLRRATEAWFSTKPAGQASGIGLWMSRRIVEEHGGTLELTSVEGRGTTARIVLPRQNSTPTIRRATQDRLG